MDSYRRQWQAAEAVPLVEKAAEEFDKNSRRGAVFAIVTVIALTEIVEYLAPTGYIFSYLYAIPILIAANRLSTVQTRWVTALGVASTLVGLVFPNPELTPLTLVNRLIVCSALWTVGYLARRYRQALQVSEDRRRALQSQLQLLDAYENFTAALTHDLKTPLQGMAQTLEVFARGRFGPLSDRQREVVGLFKSSLEKLLELTDTLLAIYRNERGTPPFKLQRTDLDVLAAGVVTEWLEAAASRQVDLMYAGLGKAWVEADDLQLGRALTNLVANAVRYTRLGSTVRVSLAMVGPLYRLRVSDEGPGIPEEDLDRLFSRFYQSPLTRQGVGTGLGLYLSRQIVEAHGGRIGAANNPDGGCTFEIVLPKHR